MRFAWLVVLLPILVFIAGCENNTCGIGEPGDSCLRADDCLCGLRCIADTCVDNAVLDRCGDYCDRLAECDTTGLMTELLVDECKSTCAEGLTNGSGQVLDDEVLACMEKPDCDSFRECLGTADLPFDGDGTDGDCTDGDCTDGDVQETVAFSGTVQDYVTSQPLIGVSVEALESATGLPLSGVSMRESGLNGIVEFFALPKDTAIAFRCTSEGDDYVPSTTFGVDPTKTGVILYIVDAVTWRSAPAMAGVTQQDGKGAVYGRVLWRNGFGQKIPVGCATVGVDAEGVDIIYFDDRILPATPEERSSIHPDNGYFMALNLPPGKTRLLAKVDNKMIGVADIVVAADEAVATEIIVVAAENPGPCSVSCKGSCDAATQSTECLDDEVCVCEGGEWVGYDCYQVCSNRDEVYITCGENDLYDFDFCVCQAP